MTERRGDQGFSVAPRRIGGDAPGPRRSRLLGILIVVGAAAAIVTAVWLGPRLADRPNLDLSFLATPTPNATPTPASSSPSALPGLTRPTGPTPLPEVTRPDGPLPAGRVALVADGLRILDLGSGQLEKAVDVQPGVDAVVRASDGRGWICVCIVDDLAGGNPVRVVRVSAIGPTGAQTDSSDVLTLPNAFEAEGSQPDTMTDVDIRANGRAGLVAIASRIDDRWRIKVASIDIDLRRAGGVVELGDATEAKLGAKPSPRASGSAAATPSVADRFLDGPHVRISPDGRVAFVWAIVQTNSVDAVIATRVHAWRVALDPDGAVGEVRALDSLERLPSFCSYATFAAADRLAWFCPQSSFDPSSAAPGAWQFGAVDLEGRDAGSREVPVQANSFYSEPLVDRANGWIYAWDPTNLILTRLDVHTLADTSVRFDPAAAAGSGIAAEGGTDRPDWRDTDSAVQQYGYGQIAGSPDGSRLYALGFEQIATSSTVTQSSLGVFVIDRTTLALIDRWAPAADYISISVDPEGEVVAAGMAGVNADGEPAPWQGSLTVHDPRDGRILVRYGRLGQDQPPLVIDR